MTELYRANGNERSAKRGRLLAGACGAALALACAFPVAAHDYTAANETELQQRIADANGDGDPTSTITLTGNIAIGSSLPASTKTLIIDTGSFATNGITPTGIVTLVGTINGTDDPTGHNGQIGLVVGAGSTITNNATVTGGDGNLTATTQALGANVINGGTLINTGTITGGNSGPGGASGGIGLQTNNTTSVTNSGLIQGGTGQSVTGGAGAFLGVGVSGTQSFVNTGTVRGGNGTGGATGGVGIALKTLTVPITNSGTIEGGNGAAAIQSSTLPVTITNSGIIRAGTGGTVAMDLSTASQVTLELQAGSSITGNVIANASSANDLLRLGGNTDATFDFSKVGATGQYRNFDFLGKTGTSTWTLTGDGGAGITSWNIAQGALVIGNGGTTGPQFAVMSDNGSLVFQRDTAITETGFVNGTGSLVQSGSGTTTLTASNDYSGGTFITGGTLSVAGDYSLGHPTSALTIDGGVLQFTGGSTTISRPISLGTHGGAIEITNSASFYSILQGLAGGGALTKSGPGGLTLAGDNTYTGGTTIAAGALNIGNGGATGSVLGDIVDNGALVFNSSNAHIYAGAITGTGTLTKNGAGTLTLTGHSSFDGATTIPIGQLLVNAGGTVVSGGATAMTSSDATLAVDGADSAFTTASINAAGSTNRTMAITVTNGGLLKTTTGGISLRALQVSAASTNRADLTIDGTGSLADVAGGLTVTNSALTTGSVTISGGGALHTGDASTIGFATGNTRVLPSVTITGTGSDWASTGALAVYNGTFSMLAGGAASFSTASFGGATASSADVVVSGSNSSFTTTGNLTVGTATGKGGTMTVAQGGTLRVGGTFTLASGAGVDGVLNIGGAEGLAADAAGFVSANAIAFGSGNGRINFNHTSPSFSLTSLISGAGVINQVAGTTLLGGDNSYTGTTSVTGGTLLVNGNQSAATALTSVASGATIGGMGTIGGDVTLVDGATLAPGSNSAGTLTIKGNLTLTSGSTLAYEFGQSGVVGGPLNDLTVVHGNLTLDGTINAAVTSGGNFDPGLYRVLSYDGTLNNQGLTVGTMPVTSSDVTVQTAVAHQVDLINTHGVTLNVWDGGNSPHGDGIVQGGAGVWQDSTGNSNWTDGAGTFTAAFTDSSFAVFTGAAGHVSVDDNPGAVTAGGVQFAVDGYVLDGGALGLTGAQATMRVGDGTAAGAAYTATVNNVLSGSAQLVKSDLGTLVLTGANTYSGGTLLRAGTLRIGSDANLGDAAGQIEFNGGTLGISASLASARAVTLTGAGTVWTNSGVTASLDGAISGAGPLTKSGTGTLVLTGANAYSGTTTVAAGTLMIDGDQSAAHGLTTVQSGATLGGNGIIGGDVAVSGKLAPGTGAVGVLTINGNLTLASTATLAYRFGDAGTAGGTLNDLVTVDGDLTLDGRINVTQSANGTFGPGIYRVFDYTGALTDNGLVVGSLPGSGHATIQTSVANQVSLVYAAASPPGGGTGGTFSFWDGAAGPKADGQIQGGSGVWQAGGSADNWTDTNGASNGAYAQNSFAVFAGTGGNVAIDNGNGAVQATGLQFADDGYVIGGDTLTLTGADATVRVGDGSNAGAGYRATINAAIAGSAGLTKTDAGTLILSGANSYSGATQVQGGTLVVNGDQSAAKGAVSVASGAMLAGSGKIGGNVNVGAGATLSPGFGGVGTLTIGGDLALASGSNVAFEVGQADTVGGTLNDLIEVGGNLTLGGTLQLSQSASGSFGPGVYRLFDYAGTLTDNGLALGGIAKDGQVAVDTATAHQVNLINSTGLTLNFWDPSGADNGAVNGGTGTWKTSGGTSWTDATGALNAPYSGAAFAVFEGTAGTVTIDGSAGPVQASGLQFGVDGYTVTGDALTLVGSQSTIRVGDGTTAGTAYKATIASVLAGNTQLVKADAGTLILSGANSYTGGTAVTGGTLQISSDGNLGAAAGGVSLNGATLRTTADMSSARTLAFDGDGTLDVNDGTTLTWNGALSGAGGLTKAGVGTLVLTADNSTFGAATRLNAGTLAVDGMLGGPVTIQTGARLEGTGQVGSVTSSGTIAPGHGGVGTLTIVGDYVANAGTLEIESGAAGIDRLVVTGATSGTTQVTLTKRDGLGGATVGDGLKIVEVGGASNGTFALKGDYQFQGQAAVVAGAYGYRLYKGGLADPTDGDWYLRSALAADGNPASGPLYQPGVPVYEAYPQTLLALNGLSTLQQRVGERNWAGGSPDSGVWGRTEATRYRPDAAVSTSGADIGVDSWQMQGGTDITLRQGADGTALIAGLNARYGEANADVASVYGNGKIKTKGFGVGATLTWYGPQGYYVDGQAQFSWYDSDLKSSLLGKLADGNNGTGKAFSLEVGKRSELGGALSLTPQAQLAYSTVDFDRFADPAGAAVSLDKGDSLRSRLGLSLDWTKTGDAHRGHVYGIVDLSYEWLDGSRVDVSNTSLLHRDARLWGEAGVGGSLSWRGRVTLFGAVSADTAIKDFGDSLKGNVGVQIAF
jgi:fibronectin-binding autotransporter adhesin